MKTLRVLSVLGAGALLGSCHQSQPATVQPRNRLKLMIDGVSGWRRQAAMMVGTL